MDNEKKIWLAGGCFWGTEHLMKTLTGVIDTEVGYANGETECPTYKEVCTGNTGYKETVEVTYDPEVIGLSEILAFYLKSIDPTAKDHQGGDWGSQYRTGIYYDDCADLPIIEKALKGEEKRWKRPIVVEVGQIECFHKAEDYHQDYLYKYPTGYCHVSSSLIQEAKAYRPKH